MKITKNNDGSSNLIIILIMGSLFALISLGLLYSMGIFPFETRETPPENDVESSGGIIGGDLDAGGCLISAGYSWCEVRKKCLRSWEEPCMAYDDQERLETYLRDNISEISPKKEVLGGKFFITNFRYLEDGRLMLDYEDGHIALRADVDFELKEEEVMITRFELIDLDTEIPEDKKEGRAELELILLFADKYDISPNDISLLVTHDKGDYLRGSVRLSPDEEASGGYFFAKMSEGGYEIVLDGNGQIECLKVKDFPEEMIEDCVE